MEPREEMEEACLLASRCGEDKGVGGGREEDVGVDGERGHVGGWMSGTSEADGEREGDGDGGRGRDSGAMDASLLVDGAGE